MKTLSKNEALALINWYDTIGINNWGVWDNYPSIGIGASYHSFDVCHCRITFDQNVLINGEQYQGVADVRNQLVPGKGNYLHIEDLKDLYSDGYKEAKELKEIQEMSASFVDFDFKKFAELQKRYPQNGNKKRRRDFERGALHACGFHKIESISTSYAFYFANEQLEKNI